MPLVDIVPYKSTGDGYGGMVLVPRNAGQLGAILTAEATTWSLVTNEADGLASPFAENDYVWIGYEKIKVGSGLNISRAQSGTAAAQHPKNALILPDSGGTTIFDQTFITENLKPFTAIRCTGHAPAQFWLYVDDVILFPPISTLYFQDAFFPMSEITPANGEKLTVKVMNFYEESLFAACLVD